MPPNAKDFSRERMLPRPLIPKPRNQPPPPRLEGRPRESSPPASRIKQPFLALLLPMYEEIGLLFYDFFEE